MTDDFRKLLNWVEEADIYEDDVDIPSDDFLGTENGIQRGLYNLSILNVTDQRTAPQELTMISWPESQKFPGFKNPEQLLPYYSNSFAGEDVFIYVIDWGVDTRHEVRSLSRDLFANFPFIQ